jgi:hypothetical protein
MNSPGRAPKINGLISASGGGDSALLGNSVAKKRSYLIMKINNSKIKHVKRVHEPSFASIKQRVNSSTLNLTIIFNNACKCHK